MTEAQHRALQVHASRAAEGHRHQDDGWARGHTPANRAWDWADLRWLVAQGFLLRKEDFMDIWFRPTEAGWQALLADKATR